MCKEFDMQPQSRHDPQVEHPTLYLHHAIGLFALRSGFSVQNNTSRDGKPTVKTPHR